MNKNLDSAYNQGYQLGWCGERYENPYTENSYDWDEFDEGYNLGILEYRNEVYE